MRISTRGKSCWMHWASRPASSFPANVAVFRVEPDDRFVLQVMSPALEALYGVPAGAGVGASVDDFQFEERTRRGLKRAYIKCRDTKAVVTMEEEIRHLDGTSVWTSRTIVPLFDKDRNAIALVSTVVDITDLVSTRRAMERSLAAVASGFTTIRAWCRRIKDREEWISLEDYLGARPDSDVVVCPDCAAAGRDQ